MKKAELLELDTVVDVVDGNNVGLRDVGVQSLDRLFKIMAEESPKRRVNI